jgi:Ulp1 protease family, C-terminal catalytic domain
MVFQTALDIDTSFNLKSIHFMAAPDPSNATRYLLGQNGLPTVHFDPKDIDILLSPTARLNNVCMNSGSALLQSWFSSPTMPSSISSAQCAILSTYDIVRIRYNASDEDLWRNIHKTSYWLRDIWVLPIHRVSPVEHWVLCVIYLRSHELFVFDSFAARRPWRQDVKVPRPPNHHDLTLTHLQDIMCLVTRMVILANRYGHKLHLITEDWTARPVSVRLFDSFTTLCTHMVPTTHSSLLFKLILTIAASGC